MIYKLYFCKEEVLQTERVIWSIIIGLNPVRFCPGPHDGTKRISGTKPIRYVTLHFRDRRGAARRGATLFRYRYRAEITQFLLVNRSPIRYGFRADARAIRYSWVDISSNGLKMALNITSGLNLIMVWSIVHQEEMNPRLLAQGGGGVLPMMAYTGRLRPKGVPFSGFRYTKR